MRAGHPGESGQPGPHPPAADRWLDDPAFAAFVDEQIRRARGEIDNRLLVAKAFGGPAGWRSERATSRLLWGGHRRDGRQVVVVTKRQAGGAAWTWVFEASRVRPQLGDPVMASSQLPNAADSLVAAVVREVRTVHDRTVSFDAYVILGPAGGTHYQIRTGGRTLRGSLDEGVPWWRWAPPGRRHPVQR